MTLPNPSFLKLSRLMLSLFLALNMLESTAQQSILDGRVLDSSSNEALSGVSVGVYQGNNLSGSISNKEGGFRVVLPIGSESVKFSMIGYRPKTIALKGLNIHSLTVRLALAPQSLSEVIVRPMSALDIVKNAIASTKKMMPSRDYQDKFFYREVIQDRQNYFSVAEAVFQTQFLPGRKDYKIELVKGRSKEDVSYTKLFEDYHPGGGPEQLFQKNLSEDFPAFLDPKKLKNFIYHRDSIMNYGDDRLYVISFDQRPDVHEALDKGRLYIEAQDFAIIRYESEDSPIGLSYVKNLTGTDKLFAELLHIDFKRKGWNESAEFIKLDSSLYLKHAFAKYRIGYRQPKKDLDLDLTISTELAETSRPFGVTEPIPREREWHRKDIVANLPTDFDAGFWGNTNIISPTTEIEEAIAQLGAATIEVSPKSLDGDWKIFQPDYFVTYQSGDSITMVPIRKAGWGDDETAGMIYQEIDGDFSVEAEVLLTKKSNRKESPENGFQQAGIIIRNPGSPGESNLNFSIGTGGNASPKYFLRKTDNGKSKGPVDKIDSLHQWLRLERRNNTITAFMKKDEVSEWKKIESFQIKWINHPLQVGLSLSCSFAGTGPKMKPDIRASVIHVKIQK